MHKFSALTGLVVPLDRSNIDTDAIIPKQFLKRISRSGFGPNLFDEWRYLDEGDADSDCSVRALNPDFALNQPRYAGAQILLTRENFGCGSSREHAPWALSDFGIRVLIAPSFADIFYINCFKNGLLPIVLPAQIVTKLMHDVTQTEGYRLEVDLPQQIVRTAEGSVHTFEVDAFRKHCLLNALDEIALSLLHAEKIKAFEAALQRSSPWLWNEARDG